MTALVTTHKLSSDSFRTAAVHIIVAARTVVDLRGNAVINACTTPGMQALATSDACSTSYGIPHVKAYRQAATRRVARRPPARHPAPGHRCSRRWPQQHTVGQASAGGSQASGSGPVGPVDGMDPAAYEEAMRRYARTNM